MKANKWIILALAMVVGLTQPAPVWSAPRKSVPADFDGDGLGDLALWHPDSGQWRFATVCHLRPDTGCGFSHGHLTGTAPSAVAAPADYDGDGLADPAYFAPATGEWHVVPLSGPRLDFRLGQAGDIPVPADYDGDGAAQPAVFHPSDGTWRVLDRVPVQFGLPGDRPVVADYDGDRVADLAVFRPSSREWIVRYSSNSVVSYQIWGLPTDVPVPGDYDGDAKSDVAVFRPAAGQWWIARSRDGILVLDLGSPGDIPVPADYDGDGVTEIAVYRPPAPAPVGPPSRGEWLIAGRPAPISFGEPGEQPVSVTVPLAT